MVKIGTAFLPVTDTAVAAAWYTETFGLTLVARDKWSAVMAGDPAGATLTLLASASGIAAQPGLTWATHNIVVDDLEQLHGDLVAHGLTAGPIGGDSRVCRWFTVVDPDGNTLLVCDR